MTYHICYTCNPPHVDNCPKCFGYGLTTNNAPIAAGEIEKYIAAPYIKCQECGGTPSNTELIGGENNE